MGVTVFRTKLVDDVRVSAFPPSPVPGASPAPVPGVLLLAVTFGAANPTKYLSKAVKAWDPKKHPKGYKGMFTETPDKQKAKALKPGDVIATKGGKAFVVEKPTEKGVKVNPLDVDTGVQKSGYTVLGHDVDVAVMETGKGPGTVHPIGQLPEGTIVKTKAGKRFKIAKHGKESVSKTGKVSKNTTVYPVDDKGEVSGKHTILPQDHVVTVDATHVGGPVTPAVVKKVDAAMEEALADLNKVDLVSPAKPKAKYGVGDGVMSQFGTGYEVKAVKDGKYLLVTSEGFEMWEPQANVDSGPWEALDAPVTVVGVSEDQGDVPIGPSDPGADLLKALFEFEHGAKATEKPVGVGDWLEMDGFKGKITTQVDAGQSWLIESPGGSSYIVDKETLGGWQPTEPPPEGPSGDLPKFVIGDDLIGPDGSKWIVQGVGPLPITNLKAGQPGYEILDELGNGEWISQELVDSSYKMDDDDGSYDDGIEYTYGPGSYHYSPQGLAQLIVDHGLDADTNEYNVLNDVLTGIEKVGHSEIGTDGMPLTGDSFVGGYAPNWAGTQKGLDLAEAYDEWKDAHDQKVAAKAGDALQETPTAQLAASMEALADALDLQVSQQPAINTMKALPDWAAFEALLVAPHAPDQHKLDLLKDTTLWTTTQKTANNHGLDLDAMVQEKLAQGEAQQAAVAAAPTAPQEVLPAKLPKVPTAYPAGVGENTAVAIETIDGTMSVWRVDGDGKRVQLIGSGYGSMTETRKAARVASADHEAIGERETTLNRDKLRNDFVNGAEPGTVVVRFDGRPYRILDVTDVAKDDLPLWTGKSGPWVHRKYTAERIGADGQPTGQTVVWDAAFQEEGGTRVPLHTAPGVSSALPALPILDDDRLADVLARLSDPSAKTSGGPGGGPYLDSAEAATLIADMGYGHTTDGALLRKARPERYTPYLQQDWSADSLVGSSVNDSLKALNKLGYREIKPRPKDQVRLIRADGKRLFLDRKGTTITGVHEPEVGQVSVDGTAKDVHARLAEALASDGDVSLLDPRLDPSPLARTSHVRGMVYDMAMGHRNGVAEKIGKQAGVKVKGDAAYLAELEAEGLAPSDAEAIEAVGTPELAIYNPRSSSLELFGLNKDDLDGDDFKTAESLDDTQATMLVAILKRKGVATMVAQPDDPAVLSHDVAADYRPELKASDPVDGARKLAAAIEDYTGFVSAGEPENAAKTTLGQMSQESRDYLLAAHDAWTDVAATALDKTDQRWAADVNAWKTAKTQGLIDARRAVEGTVAVSPASSNPFDLPVWDEIEFGPQTYSDIDALVAGIGTTPHDVPAFYTGGALDDGVLYHQKNQRSTGKVSLALDALVIERLQQAGAIEEANRDPIAPGIKASYKHYDGSQLTLTDQGGQAELSHAEKIERALKAVRETMPSHPTLEAQFATGSPSLASLQAIEARIKHWEEIGPGGPPLLTKDQADAARAALSAAQAAFPSSTGKRIEYVPHTQAAFNQGGAPTSQRGTIRLVGYTPQEGADRLRELGLLGDLEPEVPFDAILRGPRRYGALAPLHPAYVTGEADPPAIKYRITHGMTASKGDAMASLSAILDSGGLMSIAERHRQGILNDVKGASVGGDVRSGIDHALFCTTDGHGAVGSSAPVRFVLKPSAYMRRDVTLAPNDFGGCETRYGQYKSYLNKLQGEVGDKKTNLYEPASPKVRQRFIDTATGTGGEEFNIGPHVPIEDIEAIGVQTQADVEKVNAHLDSLIAKGVIASKPKVMLSGAAQQLANSGLDVSVSATMKPQVGGTLTNTNTKTTFDIVGEDQTHWTVKAQGGSTEVQVSKVSALDPWMVATAPVVLPKVGDKKANGSQVFVANTITSTGAVVATNQHGHTATWDAGSWAKLSNVAFDITKDLKPGDEVKHEYGPVYTVVNAGAGALLKADDGTEFPVSESDLKQIYTKV